MPKQKKDKFILGITGNIACGKSSVAAMFKTKDCRIIDADRLAHEFLSKGNPAYKKIKKVFGPRVLRSNQEIDRKKLGRIVFSDHAALTKLNSIVHPPLIKEIKRQIKETNKKIIILDAALIIEAGLRKMVDKLVVVTAQKNQQLLRKQKSSGLKNKEVLARNKSQISQNKKLRFADFTIDNSRSISETRKQVFAIRRKLWKS